MATVTADGMKALIGHEQVGDWIEVTQAMIDTFADATGDHQFIHVDPVRAAQTPFGGTIAHGFLTLSLMPLLATRVPDRPTLEGDRMTVNYGIDKLRFVSPVPSGSKVRGRIRLKNFHEKRPGQFERTDEFTVELEGAAKPAMVAEWMTQIFV